MGSATERPLFIIYKNCIIIYCKVRYRYPGWLLLSPLLLGVASSLPNEQRNRLRFLIRVFGAAVFGSLRYEPYPFATSYNRAIGWRKYMGNKLDGWNWHYIPIFRLFIIFTLFLVCALGLHERKILWKKREEHEQKTHFLLFYMGGIASIYQ